MVHLKKIFTVFLVLILGILFLLAPTPTTAANTVIFENGFEGGLVNNNFVGWDGTILEGSGNITASSAYKTDGMYSGLFNCPLGTTSSPVDRAHSYKQYTFPTENVLWAKTNFRFDGAGTSLQFGGGFLIQFATGIGYYNQRWNVEFYSASQEFDVPPGAYPFKIAGTANSGTPRIHGVLHTFVYPDTWYTVKMKLDYTGLNPVASYWLNGTYQDSMTDTSVLSVNATRPTFVHVGCPWWDVATREKLYIDQVGLYSADPDANLPTPTTASSSTAFPTIVSTNSPTLLPTSVFTNTPTSLPNLTPTPSPVSNGSDIQSFTNTGQAALSLTGHTSFTGVFGGNRYVYTVGGTWSNLAQKALVNSSGDIGAFTSVNQARLPFNLTWHTSEIVNMGDTTYLYVLGGANQSWAAQSAVYKATIDPNTGNVGAFTTTNQAQLPIALSGLSSAIANINGINYLYILGGGHVYKAVINSTGDIQPFTSINQSQLATAVNGHRSFTRTVNGTPYLYVVGGYNRTAAKAALTPSGDVLSFTTQNQGQLPDYLFIHAIATLNIDGVNYLYILGGQTGTGVRQSTVYKTTIDSITGNVGAFTTTNQAQLPQILADGRAVTANVSGINYLYVFGGGSPSVMKALFQASLTAPTPTAIATALPTIAATNTPTLVPTSTPTAPATYTPTQASTSTYTPTPIPTASATFTPTSLPTSTGTPVPIINGFDVQTFTSTGQATLNLTGHTSFTGVFGGNQYVYTVGGTWTNLVQKAPVNSSGDVGAFTWVNQAKLPFNLTRHTSEIVNIDGTTYLYVLGGANQSWSSQSAVYKAVIDPNTGNVGAFTTSNQAQLPVALNSLSSAIANINGTNYLYILGGGHVYKAVINPAGDIQPFTSTNQSQLVTAGKGQRSFTLSINGTPYLYVIGGDSRTAAKAALTPSGDVLPFTTQSQGQLPTYLYYPAFATLNIESMNYLYVLGGQTGSSVKQSTVYIARIDPITGNIGAFTTTNQAQLPQTLTDFRALIVNSTGSNYLYTFGGGSATVLKASLQ